MKQLLLEERHYLVWRVPPVSSDAKHFYFTSKPTFEVNWPCAQLYVLKSDFFLNFV